MPVHSWLRFRQACLPVLLTLGLALGPFHAAAGNIDIAATAAKYAASAASASAEPGVVIPPTLLVKDQEDYARYVQWQRDYARRGWEWHLRSTQFLFVMVMAIVAFGLWLTYKQFTREYVKRKPVPKPALAPDGASNATAAADEPTTIAAAPAVAPSTLKLGPAGLELTSQVVGLLVLGISVAFFYFYVKEVYPMREVERDTAAMGSAPAK